MNTVIVCPNPDDSGNNGNSSNNVANLATPIGSVLFSGSSRNCEGFLDCDGEVYSKNAFPDLYLTLINELVEVNCFILLILFNLYNKT